MLKSAFDPGLFGQNTGFGAIKGFAINVSSLLARGYLFLPCRRLFMLREVDAVLVCVVFNRLLAGL